MRKLRVLCWLLSAYLLCCSAFAAPSVNAFYEFEPVNDLEITPFALDSDVTVVYSYTASTTTMDGASQSTTLDYNGSGTSSLVSGGSADTDSVYGSYPSAKATLKAWSFSGQLKITYNFGEPQVVSLSGMPTITLQIRSKGSNFDQIVDFRELTMDNSNWTIETDSTVQSDIESFEGWNSNVQITELILTCDFGISVTGLNKSMSTYNEYYVKPAVQLNWDTDGLRVGTGGDPNTGILSGIASVLSGLIQLVQGIYNAVTDIPSLIQNIISAITSLPGLIVDGIKNLFIPSQQDLETLKTNYETMLEEKLGFVWQVGDWLTSFANTMISAFTGGTSYTFEFPGISFSMNGETHEIVPAQTVSLENAFMSVMRPVLGTAVSFICIIAFIRLGEHMLTAVVSGASYFEFLKGDGG